MKYIFFSKLTPNMQRNHECVIKGNRIETIIVDIGSLRPALDLVLRQMNITFM